MPFSSSSLINLSEYAIAESSFVLKSVWLSRISVDLKLLLLVIASGELFFLILSGGFDRRMQHLTISVFHVGFYSLVVYVGYKLFVEIAGGVNRKGKEDHMC